MLCSVWLSLALIAPAFADDEPPAANTDEGRHDLLYLTPWKPFVLRLQLLYDGVPYRRRWEQFIDERFKALDANRDGELDREEKKAISLLQLLPVAGPETRIGLLQRNPLTGHPKRSDLAMLFAQKNWKVLSFASAGASSVGQSNRQLRVASDRTALAGTTLLKQIDADGDGLLSRGELANARQALRKFDLDGNECISVLELLPQSLFGGAVPIAAPEAQTTTPDAQSNVIDLSGSPPAFIVTRLLQTYCRSEAESAAGCLSRSQLGLSETRFGKYDSDRNGMLNEDEVLDMIQNPEPDAVIVVQFGKIDDGAARLQVRSATDGSQAVLRPDGSALVSLESADFEIRIEPPASSDDLGARLQQVATAADRDMNGYVDKNEASLLGNLGQEFLKLDLDGDGQLFPKEFEKAALPAALLAQSQWRVTAVESAVDMFLAIDRNQDLKITIREFREIPALVANWDKDGDGQLSSGEIPKRIRLQIGTNDLLAQAVRAGQPAFVDRRVGGTTVAGNRPDLANAPVWFLRMDRNGDGDISRREFLGTAADFQKLDQDRDELITAAEAAATGP